MSNTPHYGGEEPRLTERAAHDVNADTVPERALHEMEYDERQRSHIEADDNELRAPGQVCARCGQVITADQDVRLVAEGRFVHEECPEAGS
jgi:hypothetical protein